MASRYNAQIVWTIGTWLDDRMGSLWGERAICTNSIQFHRTYTNKRIWICADTMAYEEGFLGIQWRWFVFVARILRILRATGWWTVRALSAEPRIPHLFKAQRGSIDVSYLHVGMDGYLVVSQSQLGVTSTWFAEWACLYIWWHPPWTHCVRWTISIDLQKHSTFGSATPGWAEEVVVHRAGHQVCPGNVPGWRLGRRRIPKEAAVFQTFKYFDPMPLMNYWPVRRSFGCSS